MNIQDFNKPVKDFTDEDIEKVESNLKLEIENYENENHKQQNVNLAVEIALKDMLREYIKKEDYQANPKLLEMRKGLLKYAVEYSMKIQNGNPYKRAPEPKRKGSFFGTFYNDDSESKS